MGVYAYDTYAADDDGRVAASLACGRCTVTAVVAILLAQSWCNAGSRSGSGGSGGWERHCMLAACGRADIRYGYGGGGSHGQESRVKINNHIFRLSDVNNRIFIL